MTSSLRYASGALASDEDGAISDAFAPGSKIDVRPQYMGMERNSFDRRDGRVLEAWRKVKVPGHASEVLEAARVTA